MKTATITSESQNLANELQDLVNSRSNELVENPTHSFLTGLKINALINKVEHAISVKQIRIYDLLYYAGLSDSLIQAVLMHTNTHNAESFIQKQIIDLRGSASQLKAGLTASAEISELIPLIQISYETHELKIN